MAWTLAAVWMALSLAPPAGVEPGGPSPEADLLAVRDACVGALRHAPLRKVLAPVYRELGGCPVLMRGRVPTEAARAVVALVGDAASHGLEARDLGGVRADPTADPEEAARRDIALMASLVRYVMAFRYRWLANPGDTPRVDAIRRRRRAKDLIRTVVRLFPDPAAGARALWPPHPQYQALRGALGRFRTLAAAGEPEPVPTKRWRKAVRKGRAPGPELVAAVRRRLSAYGVLSQSVEPDLSDAIARFRALTGLPDGRTVDGAMLRELNVPLQRRVAQIALALDRWRRSPAQRAHLQRWVRVNIPAFRLDLYDGGQVVASSRVVVGRPNEYDRTPVLFAEARRVELNPKWYVPPRLRPKDRRDVRQVIGPGKDNPLGRVKIVLFRTNAIYIHSTNKPEVFSRDVRALSHGCVRAEEALDLGRRLAALTAAAPPERYDALLATGRTRKVKLPEPVPVSFEYVTVEVEQDGQIRFLPDLYRHDTDRLSGRRVAHR